MNTRYPIEVHGEGVVFDLALVDVVGPPHEALPYPPQHERIAELLPTAAKHCADHWFPNGVRHRVHHPDGRWLWVYKIYAAGSAGVSFVEENLDIYCVVGHSQALASIYGEIRVSEDHAQGVHLWILGAAARH